MGRAGRAVGSHFFMCLQIEIMLQANWFKLFGSILDNRLFRDIFIRATFSEMIFLYWCSRRFR
jgi:hypothetical protein